MYSTDSTKGHEGEEDKVASQRSYRARMTPSSACRLYPDRWGPCKDRPLWHTDQGPPADVRYATRKVSASTALRDHPVAALRKLLTPGERTGGTRGG